MKKALKLVLAALIALPVVSLTSCEDNEDNDLFKDYSYLLDKTRENVKKDLAVTPSDEDLEGVYYENFGQPNISDLFVWFTLWNYNEEGLVTYDKAVMVDVCVTGLTYTEVYNHLTKLYGEAKMIQYEDEEYDEIETELRWEKSGKYVWLDDDEDGLWVTYAKKSEWDKAEEGTKSAEGVNIRAAHRAARAAR